MRSIGTLRRSWRSGQKVALRQVIPWWGHVLIWISIMLLVALVAWRAYQFGVSHAVSDRSVWLDDIQVLKEKNTKLEEELGQLRVLANVADTRSMQASSTQQNLTQEIARLTERNIKLSEDLATLERVVSVGSTAPLSIYSFKVEPGLEQGAFNYQMLLATSNEMSKEQFVGTMQLQAEVTTDKGEPGKITWPPKDQQGGEKYKIQFKRFLRVNQFLHIPPNFRLNKLVVQIQRDGQLMVSATAALSKGGKNVF